MNVAVISGRVTRDVDYRGSGEKGYARFSVAVNRKSRNQDGSYDADFINCVAFNKTAEFIAKYFKKGMKINVEGRLQSGSYVNQQGIKVYTLDLVVDSAEFGESKNANQANINDQNNGFRNIGEIDEELPFN